MSLEDNLNDNPNLNLNPDLNDSFNVQNRKTRSCLIRLIYFDYSGYLRTTYNRITVKL